MKKIITIAALVVATTAPALAQSVYHCQPHPGGRGYAPLCNWVTNPNPPAPNSQRQCQYVCVPHPGGQGYAPLCNWACN